MKPEIKQITSEQFLSKVVTKKANALVQIGTAWNGASQIIYQTLQDLSLQYGNEVGFFSIDYEPESAMTLTYRVENTPTILFFKEGTLVDRVSGLAHRAVISHKICQLTY